MTKLNRNIIRIIIGIKILALIGVLISVVTLSIQQFNYLTSDFPEHKDFAKEKEGVALSMLVLSIPMALSLVVDFKEQKNLILKGKWYLLTLSLIACYFLINQLKGNYAGLIVAGVMIVGIIFTLRKQNQLLNNKK